MIIDMEAPPTIVKFYSVIIQFLTFDIIPTDYIYSIMFAFKNVEPYSEHLDEMGYGSVNFIMNSGSLTIFIFAIIQATS